VDKPILSQDIPDGFRLLKTNGGFFEFVGPVYARLDEGTMSLGFRVEKQHANPVGICHGGMLMTVADMQLGFGSLAGLRVWEFYPTINMTSDFVAPAKLGDWVHGEAEVIRATRNLVFASCVLMVGDEPVMRASGVLKRGNPDGGEVDIDRFFVDGS